MNSGTTADRVYAALKRRILSGALAPGQKMDPTRFAEDLASSVTPVRDALHRLSGERLVDISDGFHVPMMTEPRLYDRYIWNARLLRLAVQTAPRTCPAVPTDLPVDLDRAPAALFETMALRSGNEELRAQIKASNDRLATARIAERDVFADLEGELRRFAIALDHEPRRQILTELAGYHRRRLRAVPRIVRAMYAQS